MKYSVEQGLARLPGPNGERFAELIAHGTMRPELYAPRGDDPQQPHAQDGLYFIHSGRGQFVQGQERHRFEEFTDDFATWVVFWGPPGGER